MSVRATSRWEGCRRVWRKPDGRFASKAQIAAALRLERVEARQDAQWAARAVRDDGWAGETAVAATLREMAAKEPAKYPRRYSVGA